MLPNYDQMRNIHYASLLRSHSPNAKHVEHASQPIHDHFVNKVQC